MRLHSTALSFNRRKLFPILKIVIMVAASLVVCIAPAIKTSVITAKILFRI